MTSRGMQQMRCLPTSTGISSIPATKMSASGSSQQGRHQKSHSLFPGSRGRQFFPSALMRRNFNFPRSIWWSTTGCQSISSGLQCSMYRVFKTVSLRSSKAFKAMGDTVLKTLFKAFQDRPDIFTTIEQPINSLQEFEKEFFFALKDFHKTAIQRYQPCFLCVMQCNILCR